MWRCCKQKDLDIHWDKLFFIDIEYGETIPCGRVIYFTNDVQLDDLWNRVLRENFYKIYQAMNRRHRIVTTLYILILCNHSIEVVNSSKYMCQLVKERQQIYSIIHYSWNNSFTIMLIVSCRNASNLSETNNYI